MQKEIWPVMLTPFTRDDKIDKTALHALVDWYIAGGVTGLFAVCQSSEMFRLSLSERIELAGLVKEYAAGRVPVIASGHISETREEQVRELTEIAQTGVNALILLTNRMAAEGEDDEVWIRNADVLLASLPPSVHLGLYECPYPYKRVMSARTTRWCAETGRFYFLKDTSCDIDRVREKVDLCRDTPLRVYNANTATLLASLRSGAAGYSGVMANMHLGLYRALLSDIDAPGAELLSAFLTVSALIERQWYPVNAKYYLQLEGLPIELYARVQDAAGLTETYRSEVRMLRALSKEAAARYAEHGKEAAPAETGLQRGKKT